MEVVVHDYPRMDGDLKNLGIFTPQSQQTVSIGIVTNNGLAIVAALDDVVGISSDSKAGLTGHA
jgi:hypothetical protein